MLADCDTGYAEEAELCDIETSEDDLIITKYDDWLLISFCDRLWRHF